MVLQPTQGDHAEWYAWGHTQPQTSVFRIGLYATEQHAAGTDLAMTGLLEYSWSSLQPG